MPWARRTCIQMSENSWHSWGHIVNVFRKEMTFPISAMMSCVFYGVPLIVFNFWIDQRFWSFLEAQPVLCWHPDAMVPMPQRYPDTVRFRCTIGSCKHRVFAIWNTILTLWWLQSPWRNAWWWKKNSPWKPKVGVAPKRKTCQFGDWIIRDDHAIGRKPLKTKTPWL